MGAERGDTIVREVGAETVVYDLRTHRAHCLGPTAAAIWRAWDGHAGPAETARRVSLLLPEPVDEASVRLVWRRLRKAGLVGEPSRRSDSHRRRPAAPARRRVVQGLGVAAGLMVLSVASRSPAQAAATCIPNGRPCVHSPQCCSHCCNEPPGRCAGGGQCAP